MNQPKQPAPIRISRRWRPAIAALASTVLLGGHLVPSLAIANPVQISQAQAEWQPALNIVQLNDRRQLAVQLDLLNKPATSYGNVAYFIYARQNNQWVQLMTNTGARMMTDNAGRNTLSPEFFPLDELRQRLGNRDLSQVELKFVTLIRYDLRGGQRLQTIQFERIQRYSEIAQISSTQLATYTSSSQVIASRETIVVTNPGSPFGSRPVSSTALNREQSRFSLAIVQKKSKLSNVIARVSLKPRLANGFSQEQFIGDFRYKLKGKKNQARFIKGLYAGDRVVVRLFTTSNQLIGYSEFELLSTSNTVTLILPERSEEYGIVRTVYGVDRNEDFEVDRNTPIYDYFTRVTQSQSYSESRVTFLSSAQMIDLGLFDVAGYPTPRPTCTYPLSFLSGSWTLVNQVIQVFSNGLPPALIAIPGQIVQITNINTNVLSIYEVRQQIVQYRTVGVTQGSVISVDGDRDDDDQGRSKPRKRHCNQGIGNGAEGCDPGNSRPHGGSNDEGSRAGRRNR